MEADLARVHPSMRNLLAGRTAWPVLPEEYPLLLSSSSLALVQRRVPAAQVSILGQVQKRQVVAEVGVFAFLRFAHQSLASPSVEYMGFSSSGNEIFVARQFYLDVYDLEGNRIKSAQLEYHAKPTHLIAGMFGSFVLVGDTVGHVMLADTSSEKRPQLKGGLYPDAALFIESNSEANRAIVVFESGRVQFVVINDPSSPAEYELGTKGTIHAAFIPRPHTGRFLTASQTGQIDVWRFADGAPAKLASFNHGTTPVGLASFSGDGARIISLSDDDVYKVWDISKRELVVSYPWGIRSTNPVLH